MKATATIARALVITANSDWVSVPVTRTGSHNGVEYVIHRSINGRDWCATSTVCGRAIATGRTRDDAEQVAREKISGCEDIHKLIAKAAKANPMPATGTPVEKLPGYVKPRTKKAPAATKDRTTGKPVDIAAIARKVAEIALLDEDEEAAVQRALSGAGANRGRLLATCPAIFGRGADAMAAAAWLGLQPNPWKCSVAKTMLLTGKARTLVTKLAARSWPTWLDKDAATLDRLGVW